MHIACYVIRVKQAAGTGDFELEIFRSAKTLLRPGL